MKFLPLLLSKVEEKQVPVILIKPNWLRRTCCTDILRLLVDEPWPLPSWPDLQAQDIPCSILLLSHWLLRHQNQLHQSCWCLLGFTASNICIADFQGHYLVLCSHIFQVLPSERSGLGWCKLWQQGVLSCYLSILFWFLNHLPTAHRQTAAMWLPCVNGRSCMAAAFKGYRGRMPHHLKARE